MAAGGGGGVAAHVGVVEVDAPVAPRTGGNEAVPRFDTDGTAGSTDTLLEGELMEFILTYL